MKVMNDQKKEGKEERKEERFLMAIKAFLVRKRYSLLRGPEVFIEKTLVGAEL